MSLDTHSRTFDDHPTGHDPDLMAPADEPLTPERRLWLAVIDRVWLDAFVSRDPTINNSEGYSSASLEIQETVAHGVRSEARRWLVSRLDPWRGDRRDVCDLAGISESVLCRAAKARLAVAKAGEAEAAKVEAQAERKRAYNRERMRHIRAQQKIDRAFEELLSAESSMSSADVDSALRQLAELEQMAA